MKIDIEPILAFVFINLIFSIVYLGIWLNNFYVQVLATLVFLIITTILTNDLIEDKKNK